MAGQKEVAVLVADKSDKAAKLTGLVVNLLRENYPSGIVERKVVELWESGDYKTQQDLARSLGKSQPWISEQLSAYRYRRDNGLSDDLSHEAVRQVMHAAPDVKEEALEKIRSGKLSSYEARRIALNTANSTKSNQDSLRLHMRERTEAVNKAEPIRFNLLRHRDIQYAIDRKQGAACPVCGAKKLGWLCSDKLTLDEAIHKLEKELQSAEDRLKDHLGDKGQSERATSSHRN